MLYVSVGMLYKKEIVQKALTWSILYFFTKFNKDN